MKMMRVSFAPLCFAWTDVEDEVAYPFLFESYRAWLRHFDAALADKYETCEAVVTNFHAGLASAAKRAFPHARMQTCFVHLLRIATHQGHTGMTHLEHHQNGATLRRLLRDMYLRPNQATCDFLANHVFLMVSPSAAWRAS